MTTYGNDTQALVLASVREMDRLDEEQILESMIGDYKGDFAYEFPMGSGAEQKTVRGLSWRGYMELVTTRGGYVFGKPEVEDAGDHWRAYAEVTDMIQNVTVWAGTHQPKSRRINNRDGGQGYRTVPDDYSFEKAISKAQRNAAKNIIPHSVQVHALERVLGGKALPQGRGRNEERPQGRTLPNQRQQLQEPAESVDPTQLEPPKNLGELYTNAQKYLGYANKQEVIQAAGVTSEADISDLNEVWGRLLVHKGFSDPEPFMSEEDQEALAALR